MSELKTTKQVASRLRYVGMCPKQPSSELKLYHLKLFKLWYAVYTHTFSKIYSGQKVYSDTFLVQDEVSGIFMEDEAIGVIFNSWIDLDDPVHRGLHYFSAYSNECLKALRAEGNKVMVMSNLAVHPAWRKELSSFHLAKVLISLSIFRFLESSACNLISHSRNDRNVHQLVYELGGEKFAEGQIHNIDSDFIKISKKKAQVCNLGTINSLVQKLWGEKLFSKKIEHLDNGVYSSMVGHKNEVSA